MSKPLIVGNWKLHKTLLESVQYIEAGGEALNQLTTVEVVLCPSFISLTVIEGLLRGTQIRLGAQTISAWKEGAYTGEVSASMVVPHCQYAIIGHSERRRLCNETPDIVNSKIRRALEVNLTPIICISSEAELDALDEISEKLDSWIIAFEPLEAIGSGKAEDPASVIQMGKMIKSHLGKSTRVLYGGSVDPNNVSQYIAISDGALVGGASLDPQKFLALCQAAGK